MSLLKRWVSTSARLKKAWVAFWAPPMERVLCDCGTWFYRIAKPHPDTCCTACDANLMNDWADQARKERVIW
jgi:hypothetical protein